MKTYYVGNFTIKERAAGGSGYENEFDDTMRRTPAETKAVIARRRARAAAIKLQNETRKFQ